MLVTATAGSYSNKNGVGIRSLGAEKAVELIKSIVGRSPGKNVLANSLKKPL